MAIITMCRITLLRSGAARVSLVSLALVGLLHPSQAMSLASPDGDSSAPLEEVVVTARKIEESVQDVPMSVQVLDADLLEMTGGTHPLDLQFRIPGLVVNNLGHNGAGFSLRAVADQGGSSLSVATHLDGVYLGSPNLSVARLFDVERIEILKGPQGTLYGRNATGGSINIVPQRPEKAFGAGVEAALGSFDTLQAQGHVNFALERSAFRVAFVVSDGDGFIRNSVDDRRFAAQTFRGVRAVYRADPTDRLQIDIMAQHVEDDGAVGELWLPRPDFLADRSDIRLATVTLPNPFLESEIDNVSVGAEYDLGFAVLKSISGYARSQVRNVDDCAGLPILLGCVRSVMPSRHEQLSQELRLGVSETGRVAWLVGAHYYQGDGLRAYYQLTPVIDPDPTSNNVSSSGEKSLAAFGQVTWKLSNRWSLTGGLRLSRNDHRLATIGTGTDDSATGASAAEGWTNESWRMDLDFAVDDDMLLYANVSTGFKSGGIGFLAGGVADPFGPEHLTAYEAGMKSLWRDRRVRINAAAFYYDFRDLQVSTSTISGDGLIFETDNAASAEIYGIDSEGDVRLGGRLTVSAAIVWLPKREFVEYRNDRTGDTLSGNKLVRAPEWSATTAIGVEQPMAGSGRLLARLEYNYRSGFFYTTDNNPQFAQGAFGLLNAYLRYESADATWYAFVAGRNLEDKDYFNQVFLQASPGYPRTFEAGLGYRF